jgi:diketogulonate reductase-like aldo/keto reductase
MTLIDTAEMYGDGAAETIVGEAISGGRSGVFLVSKVHPRNARRNATIEACERSLERLRTDYLDLYLLHWIGSVSVMETLEAFQLLKQAGKIREYGVSNFDLDEIEDAMALPGGAEIATNQVLYSLKHRGIEWDLLPWCRKRKTPIMAYSPLEHSASEQAGMLDNPQLKAIAFRHNATPAQVALAWVIRQDGVIAIPKASNAEHVRENRAAAGLTFTDDDLKELGREFPPPRRKTELEMK